MVYPPKVHIKEAAAVFLAHFIEASVNRHPGIINPGIDLPEAINGDLGDALHFVTIGNVSMDERGIPAR